MFGFYLFIAIFADLSRVGLKPQSVIAHSPVESKVNVSVTFNELNDIKVGTPVFAKGEVIGKVEKIEKTVSKNKQQKATVTKFNVALSLKNTVSQSAIILQSTPASSQNIKPKTFLELLNLPSQSIKTISEGQQLLGFSSYEDFWRDEKLASKF